MALQYLFDPNKQFQNIDGVNNVSGFLRVFLNGTDDRATTYRNFDGGLNEPEIVFDTNGRAVVIVDDTKTYRLEVYNRLGGLMWTVTNYKARGGSGGGSTPVEVKGTAGEIDVYENTISGVKHFIVSLAENVKNAISSLTSAVNGLALSLGNKKEKQTAKEFLGGTTKTVVGVTQNEDGEVSVVFGDIPLDNYELKENKKTTVTSYEGSNTYYPTIKAVVDFVNGMMQNLGGKLITDNGDPFTDSASLPTTTPFQSVDIADKDYAYIQGVGTAERWSATVSGTSVAWVQEYAISIPVFTPSQQAVIDGDSSDMTATFTTAGSRSNILTSDKLSVIFGKIAKWFADLKTVAFTGNYSDLSGVPNINNGVLTITQNGVSKGTFSANQSSNNTIEVKDTTYESKAAASGGTNTSLVTTGEKYMWNSKGSTMAWGEQRAYSIIVSNTVSSAPGWISVVEVDTTSTQYKSVCVRGRFIIANGNWAQNTNSEVEFQAVLCAVDHTASHIVVSPFYVGVDNNANCAFGVGNPSEWIRIAKSASNNMELQVNLPTNNAGYAVYYEVSGDAPFVANTTVKSGITPATIVSPTYDYGAGKVIGYGGSPTVPVYVDPYGRVQACSLPTSVQTWVGEVYSSATCEYYGGVYRFRGNLALNHGWGDSTHGYINYQMIVTRAARKGKNCACGFRLTPHYSGGTGISFKQIYSQFVDSPSVFIDESQLHESGIGPCGTGSGRTIPTSLDYDIVVESSDWSVGETVNISLYATAVKL